MKRFLTRFRWVGFLALGLAAGFLWSPTKAAEEIGEYDVISFADLGFTSGGMSGRFLFFEQWTDSPTIPYPANTVLQHNSQLWVALTTPGATDEPGTAAVWLQLTGGGGATLTQEQVEDFVGAMVDGNTETGITVTYDDTDGTLDFVVTGGGLATVATDATITGDGSAGDPLSVANPFEAADETKLDGIAAGAEVNVQVDWAETDTTSDAFIENKPTIPAASTDDQTAAEVPVAAAGFNGNLDTSDTNVQLVAQALDDLVIPMADGVVESATFADATYMVTFDRTVGADVLLDLSVILTARERAGCPRDPPRGLPPDTAARRHPLRRPPGGWLNGRRLHGDRLPRRRRDLLDVNRHRLTGQRDRHGRRYRGAVIRGHPDGGRRIGRRRQPQPAGLDDPRDFRAERDRYADHARHQ